MAKTTADELGGQKKVLVNLNPAERARMARLKIAFGIPKGVDVVRLALVELERLATARDRTPKSA